MEDYRSNSHRSKEENIRNNSVKTVVSGNTKTRKKNKIRKFTDVFLADDISSLKSYIFTDVFVPYAKRFLDDAFHTFLYRNSGGRNSYPDRRRNETTYNPYNRYYGDDRVSSNRPIRRPYEFEDIVYDDRGDAELVLDVLRDRIASYGYATLMDLYTASNRDCSYTYDRYGWSNLMDARVIPVYDGYIIKLPRAYPIEERR